MIIGYKNIAAKYQEDKHTQIKLELKACCGGDRVACGGESSMAAKSKIVGTKNSQKTSYNA